MHDYGVLYMAFIIWNEGWFDLVERYGKSLTRSAWLLWKFWASLNFSHPEFEFLIIRRQTFLIPITQDICDVYSAREAEFSKPETQERQVIKGGVTEIYQSKVLAQLSKWTPYWRGHQHWISSDWLVHAVQILGWTIFHVSNFNVCLLFT